MFTPHSRDNARIVSSTDAALALGLMHVIVAEGRVFEAQLGQRVELARSARPAPPSVPVADIQRYVDTVGVLTLGIGALALIAWALWLSRAVTAMPALGLGTPSTTGMTAFIWSIVPIGNLIQVPPIVRDVVVRLGSDAAWSGILITAAWVGLIVGFAGPWLAWYMLFGGGSGLTEVATMSR